MRCLFSIFAGLWLATATLAGDQAPTLSEDCSQPVSAGCRSGADLYPHAAVECGPSCASEGRFWGSVDFLYWHADGYNAPPLLTTSLPGVPLSAAGALGVPGTTVLAGGGDLNDDEFPGLRFEGGVWLGECRTLGIGGSYFLLFDDTDVTRVSSPGTPSLSRPFFNVALGRPDAEIIAFPGVASGTGAVATSFALQGADANVRCNLYCTPDTPCDCGRSGGWRLDALFGYRYLRLHEDLVIGEDLITGPASDVTPGTRFV